MKSRFFNLPNAALVLLPVFVVFAAAVEAQPSGPGEFPDVVATVNGVAVTKAELLTQAALVRSQMRKVDGAAPKADLKFYRGILDGLVGEALIFDDGSKRGLGATDEEVERAIQGLRSAHANDEAFQASLVEQGTSLIQLRDQLHRSLSLEKIMRQELGSKSIVDEVEARQFYDQNENLMRTPPRVRVRHILLKADKGDPESVRAARLRLGELKRKVQAGENFEVLARAHSEDLATRDAGGVLPWVPITDSEADQRLYALDVGELSRIEETDHGFHLIEILEKEPAGLVPFEQAKDRITFMLENSRMRLEVQQRVEKLRQSADIKLFI